LESSVSRRFVALTRAQLTTWLAQRLDGLDVRIILIDGLHFRDHAAAVAPDCRGPCFAPWVVVVAVGAAVPTLLSPAVILGAPLPGFDDRVTLPEPPRRAWSGVQRLQCAILLGAIEDANRTGSVRSQRLTRDALEWIASDDDEYLFAFISICQSLALAAGCGAARDRGNDAAPDHAAPSRVAPGAGAPRALPATNGS
jgi:hypothetical protein